MKQVAIGTIILLTTVALEAGPYKCADPDTGVVTYSQTQCLGSSNDEIKISRSPTSAHDKDGQESCYAAIRARLKNPESMRVEAAGKMELDVIQYAGTKILAYKLPVVVNAKNSYGGYTGSKVWTCILGQNDKSVLGVLSP